MLLTLLSPQGAAAISTVLAASEAKDTASFTAALRTSVVLAASEAKDTASFTAALRTSVVLAASEAKDTASFTATLRTSMTLAASEARDGMGFNVVVGNLPTEQFTVSGPYVTDTFTTTTLSYPYDIKKRTA